MELNNTLNFNFKHLDCELRNIYPDEPKFINKINLVTYIDGKVTGWFSNGFRLSEYIRKPWSWGVL